MPHLAVEPLDVLRGRRSAKWRRYPSDVLPLTVAEMDFRIAEPISDALHAAVDRADTGYAMAEPGLGAALAGFAGRRWGWEIDPVRVAAVADVGVGVVELLRVLCKPGDAVVINTPVYAPAHTWPVEAGGHPLEAPLTAAGGLDLAALKRAFATGPAAYVLCNPHNPTGRVHTADELAEVVRLARHHRVPVVCDEIHAPLVLPGARYTPLLTVPGAAEVAVSLLSASKAWNLAGLKCAAVVAASPAMHEVLDRLPFDLRWRVGHFGVIAAIAAFTECEPWLDDLLSTVDDRRTRLGALLREKLPSVRWRPPEATFLAWLDCADYGTGDEPYERFIEHGRVALDPGLKFGTEGSGYTRLNFATSTEVLELAINGMAATPTVR